MGRFRRLAAGAILLGSLLVTPGCARVSQTGEATVISHSWVSLLAIFAIGMTMVVFGVGIAKESMEAARPKKRKRGATKSKAKPRRSAGTYFGVGLTIAGLLILVLGVPSAYVASVTVHPDRVVFRDALFWWANEPRQFDYANLTGIDIAVVEMPIKRRGRKDKEYLVLTGTLSQDRREMNSLLRAAHPVLLGAWQQYRAGNANIAAAEPAPGLPASTTAPMPSPLDEIATKLPDDAPKRDTPSPFPSGPVAGGISRQTPSDLTPIPVMGPYHTGKFVVVQRDGMMVRAEILEVYREQQLRIRYEDAGDEAVVPIRGVRLVGRFASTGGSRPGTVTEVTAEPPGELTPVESIGRFRTGVFIMAPRNGTYTRAEVLEVFREQRIRVRYEGDQSNEVATIPMADARPAASARLAKPDEGPGRTIANVSEIRPGMTLWGHYDGHWSSVEVVEVSDRRITIQWPGERFRERVPLSWLRIPTE